MTWPKGTRSAARGDIDADLDMVYTYFPRLKERRKSQAGYTSGGEQQMVAIGRALMSRPETIRQVPPETLRVDAAHSEVFHHHVGEVECDGSHISMLRPS